MRDGLEIKDLTVLRGGTRVVRGVSLHVPPGEVTVLVGPNGAGKTSLLEAVSGVIPAAQGEVLLAGSDISTYSRVKRARAGITHVEQGRTIFGDLTVAENLRVIREDVHEAWELFPELDRRRASLARSLSGGEQQMLVIARSLLRRPSVLLIDEVSLGLAPIVVQRIMPVLRQAAERGIAVLLVEQFISLALQIGDTAHVLNHGQIMLTERCETLKDDPSRVSRAYFAG